MEEVTPETRDHCMVTFSSAPGCQQDRTLVRTLLQHIPAMSSHSTAVAGPPDAGLHLASCKILRRLGQRHPFGKQEDAKDARGYVHVRVQAACGLLADALPARALPADAAAQRSALPALDATAGPTHAFQPADSWARDSGGCWEAACSEDSTTDSLEALVAQLVGPPTCGNR